MSVRFVKRRCQHLLSKTHRRADQQLKRSRKHTESLRGTTADCTVTTTTTTSSSTSTSSVCSAPCMLWAGSTCCPSSGTWRWQVPGEELGCPPCPLPTHRCPPARPRAPTPRDARAEPSWTRLGSSCKVYWLWWPSAPWCVSISRALLWECQISDSRCC